MDEELTLAQIYERFPEEWVLVVDPTLDDAYEVLKGQIACHSKTRDDVYRRAVELMPKSSGFLYTGRIPAPGSALLL